MIAYLRLSPGFFIRVPLGRLFDKLKTAPLGLNAKLTVLTSLSQTSRKYQDVMMVVMTNELKNEGSLLERFLLEGFKTSCRRPQSSRKLCLYPSRSVETDENVGSEPIMLD